MAAVTQFDIASQLGMSRSTVKAALTPHPRVQLSPVTRKRVVDTAHEMGYRVNTHARSMRTGKSGVIGMLQFAAAVQFSVQRTLQIARAIHAHGYQPLASESNWYPKNLTAACDMMLDARVEGVVLLSPPRCFPKQDVMRLQRVGISVVSVAGMPLPRVPYVRADVHSGIRDLTRHLLQLGHRRLVLLTRDLTLPKSAPDRTWQLLERMAGFREALKAAGGVVRETTWMEHSARSGDTLFAGDGKRRGPVGEIVRYAFPDERADDCEHGFMAMRHLLKVRGDADTVLCSNDDWAMGALAACDEAGVRVPQELAVTGFDDMLYARYSAIPLTTVAQPLEQMAGHAVGLLVRMIRGEKPAASELAVKMPCQLVVRRSCGAGQA